MVTLDLCFESAMTSHLEPLTDEISADVRLDMDCLCTAGVLTRITYMVWVRRCLSSRSSVLPPHSTGSQLALTIPHDRP